MKLEELEELHEDIRKIDRDESGFFRYACWYPTHLPIPGISYAMAVLLERNITALIKK